MTDAAHPCDDPPGECQAHAAGGELCPLGVCRRDPQYGPESYGVRWTLPHKSHAMDPDFCFMCGVHDYDAAIGTPCVMAFAFNGEEAAGGQQPAT